MNDIYKKTILNVENINGLANALNIAKHELKYLVEYPSYKSYSIPKKKGGERHILAPNKSLKNTQSYMNVLLQKIYTAPDDVHAFINNKDRCSRNDIYANASMHIGKNYVWNIDLKDFFSSINTTQIKNIFEQAPFNYNEPLAAYTALLFCYKKQLPTGAPSSPMLSNFVCQDLDKKLRRCVSEINALSNNFLVYSRYADDCTFSYNKVLSEKNKEDIIAIIRGFGFELNPKKNRVQNKNQAQWVTGIKVNEKLNLDRRYIRNIRAILHHATTQGIEKATVKYLYLSDEQLVTKEHITRFLNSLKGKIMYVGYVKGFKNDVFIKLINAYNNNIKQKVSDM